MVSLLDMPFISACRQSVACELIPLVFLHIVLHIDHAHVALVHNQLARADVLLAMPVLGLSEHPRLVRFYLQCCTFYDLLRNSLLHKIHFALSDKFHVGISERDEQLVAAAVQQSPQSTRLSPSEEVALLSGRKDQERVRLGREVEVFAEWRSDKEMRVCFHLEQVVLLLPNKWDTLELAHGVALGHLDVTELSLRLVSLGEHKVEN